MEYCNVALFSDLDGTLFNSNREVSTENKDAIRHFVSNGGIFGVSTGRAPVNIERMVSGIEINSWSVVLNGAEAYRFSDKRTSAQHSLPKEPMASLVRWILKTLPEVNIQLCTENQLLFLSSPDQADTDFVLTHQPMTNMCVDDALQYDWLKLLFCAPHPVLKQIWRYAQETGAFSEANCVFSSDVYLEFLPLHVSKGSCLKELRSQEELRGRTIIAVGDYSNDIELLQEADVSVAVQNALPELKAFADYIVSSNDDHALADLISNLIPRL